MGEKVLHKFRINFLLYFTNTRNDLYRLSVFGGGIAIMAAVLLSSGDIAV